MALTVIRSASMHTQGVLNQQTGHSQLKTSPALLDRLIFFKESACDLDFVGVAQPQDTLELFHRSPRARLGLPQVTNDGDPGRFEKAALVDPEQLAPER